MRHPGRFLLLVLPLAIPINVVIALAEARWDLGPDATFGLFAVLALAAMFLALRITDGFVFRPPPHDRDEG